MFSSIGESIKAIAILGIGMAAEGYSAEELAYDGSQARIALANATTCLWDIDRSELTTRERKRLATVLRKIDELEDIIEEREIQEVRERE